MAVTLIAVSFLVLPVPFPLFQEIPLTFLLGTQATPENVKIGKIGLNASMPVSISSGQGFFDRRLGTSYSL